MPDDSPITSVDGVDRAGVRVGVKQGAAYDLYLTRTLEHAELVRGAEGAEIFLEHGLEVGAGIRQPLTAFVAEHAGLRVLDEAFMQIRQAVATPRGRRPETVDFLGSVVEELKASGFVADALRRAGHDDVTVAPPA